MVSDTSAYRRPVDERLYLDDPDISQAVKQRHVDRYLTAIMLVGFSGGRWLDAACGSGYGSWLMTEYADQVIAVDRDRDAIRYALAHYSAANPESPPVQFICEDILDGSLGLGVLRNQQYNVVISIETLEHLGQPQQKAWVRRVARELLLPGGIFVLTTPIRKGGGPNPLNPHHQWEPDRDRLMSMLSVYFDKATTLSHSVEMTTGETQLNLYVRCEL